MGNKIVLLAQGINKSTGGVYIAENDRRKSARIELNGVVTRPSGPELLKKKHLEGTPLP